MYAHIPSKFVSDADGMDANGVDFSYQRVETVKHVKLLMKHETHWK